MKNNSNITIVDAFRIASQVSGRTPDTMTLGDVADIFGNISSLVASALVNGAPAKEAPKAKAKATRTRKAKAAPTMAEPKADSGNDGNGGNGGKRGRGRPKGSGGGSRPGGRRGLVEKIISDAGGTMPVASVASQVIKEEGVTDESSIPSVRNAVYAIINKMVESGEAHVVADKPRTVGLGSRQSQQSVTRSKAPEMHEIEA